MTHPAPEGDGLSCCPFCGGAASFEQIDNDASPQHLRWSVGCRNEDCIGYQSLTTYPRKADARAAWNRRPHGTAAAPELLAALIDLLHQSKLSQDEGGWDFEQAETAIAKATGMTANA